MSTAGDQKRAPGRDAKHGSSSPQQRERLAKAAAAYGTDSRGVQVYASQLRLRAQKKYVLPMLWNVMDMSRDECTSLITQLERHARDGTRMPGVCARCIRIGLDNGVPCIHDNPNIGRKSNYRRTDAEWMMRERERGQW